MPCRQCTESPKNIKSQLGDQDVVVVRSVLNLQRTSNHNPARCRPAGRRSVLNLQRTSNHNYSSCCAACAPSVLNLQRTSNHNSSTCSTASVKCTESPKNIKSQPVRQPVQPRSSVLNLQRTSNHNRPVGFEVGNRSVLNLQRTSNHNFSALRCALRAVY